MAELIAYIKYVLCAGSSRVIAKNKNKLSAHVTSMSQENSRYESILSKDAARLTSVAKLSNVGY